MLTLTVLRIPRSGPSASSPSAKRASPSLSRICPSKFPGPGFPAPSVAKTWCKLYLWRKGCAFVELMRCMSGVW